MKIFSLICVKNEWTVKKSEYIKLASFCLGYRYMEACHSRNMTWNNEAVVSKAHNYATLKCHGKIVYK